MNSPETTTPSTPPNEDATTERLQYHLKCLLEKPVQVKITDNRHIMVSWSPPSHGVLRLRVHRLFLSAPPPVIEALAGLTVKVPGAREVLHRYISANSHEIRHRKRHRILRPRGIELDLRDVHNDLNNRFFNGHSTAGVTWGRATVQKRVRHLRFGTYDYEAGVITLNQRLNALGIPRYMVAFVMYHEMLHEHLGAEVSNSGRRRVHTRRFRQLERAFPDYEKAMAFQKKRWGVM